MKTSKYFTLGRHYDPLEGGSSEALSSNQHLSTRLPTARAASNFDSKSRRSPISLEVCIVLIIVLENRFAAQRVPIAFYVIPNLEFALTSQKFNDREAVVVLNYDHTSITRNKNNLPPGHPFPPATKRFAKLSTTKGSIDSPVNRTESKMDL